MVHPIVQGDRGPAVEDVQKRLLTLGFDLGPTGVDGVFWGATLAAVRRFQEDRGLAEDGVVGDETWSALVDATFRLGDRLLYLKLPYLHGADVGALQGALNVLGFACGDPDGIFGPFTERAVREFQSNVALSSDGIVGPETVRAVERLHHVWEGKNPASPAALAVAPARAAEVLRDANVALVGRDSCGLAIAERVANLAHAAERDAHVGVMSLQDAQGRDLVLHLGATEDAVSSDRMPIIAIGPEEHFEGRFIAASQAAADAREAFVLLPSPVCEDEHDAQAIAVRVLDGLCAVLSGKIAPAAR